MAPVQGLVFKLHPDSISAQDQSGKEPSGTTRNPCRIQLLAENLYDTKSQHQTAKNPQLATLGRIVSTQPTILPDRDV
jgi:hypothetical protein